MRAGATGRRSFGRRAAVTLTGAGVLGAAALAAGGTLAQDAPNPALTLSFGSTLNANDNLGLDPKATGTSKWIDNKLGLSWLSETAVSSLKFDASGVLRVSDLPDRPRKTEFDDQTLGLGYTLNGANSRVTAKAGYNRADVAFFDPLFLVDNPDTPFDEADLNTANRGDRITRNASLKFETGLEGPFGMSLAASHYGRSYTDSTNPDFYDTTRDTVSLGATLRPSPRLGLNFGLSQSHYTASDSEDTDRTTRRATVGATYALDAATTLSFSVGKIWIETEENGFLVPRVRSDEDGLNGSLGLTRDLENGSVGLSVVHDIATDGDTWTEVLFSRTMDILPEGNLSVSIGPGFQENGDTAVVGTLAYGQKLGLGSLNASASRQISTSDTDDSTRETTRLGLGWAQGLTPVSGFNVSVDYLDVESDRAGADRSRARLSLAYTHELAQDWQIQGGYTHTYSDREDEGTAQSNALFLTLQKNLTFAP